MGTRAIAPKGRWREFRLIEQIRRCCGRTGSGDALGLGDDAAAYRPDAKQLEIVTCDAMVEDVHWESAWCSLRDVGVKIAASNISDIAAMGGVPQRAYLTLALPGQTLEKAALDLVKGLDSELARYGARLSGGDTVATPGPLLVSLTLQGIVPAAEMIARTGARAGDAILVTGDLGAAAAGLRLAKNPRLRIPGRPALVRRLLRPAPRVAAGRCLARSRQVHAMLDLSDGLAGDLRHLTSAGKVGARIHAAAVPLSPATRRAAQALRQVPLDLALTGGEDYELLFTASSRQAPELIRKLKQECALACTVIGEILPARHGVTLLHADGREVPMPAGWAHNQ